MKKDNFTVIKEEIAKLKRLSYYSFSKTKGLFLLGMLIAIGSYGVYMAQPSQEMILDARGVANFVQCSNSLNLGDVDETSCRNYYEQYLDVRISKTDNLPKIISAEIIGSTYVIVQKALKEKDLPPLTPLEVVTNKKIQVLKSGKVIASES